jgi:hypothetical protein
VEKDIGMASVRLLDAAGVDFTYLGEKENCCATPMLVAGKWGLFEETMKKKYPGSKINRGRYRYNLLPRLRFDVAPGLSGMGEETWYRIRYRDQTLQPDSF